jgi:hypothetical protein
MKKNYQTDAARAAMSEIVVRDAVSVAMSELTAAMREGLLALAVGAGLQVMQVLMDESVTALAGPKDKHDPDRAGVRHGTESGSVVLGGRQVSVRRPRVRTADKTTEVAVPSYELFASTELLGELGLERMMAKLSTRRYRAGLEPVGAAVEALARSTSRSAVSRRFVAMTERVGAENSSGHAEQAFRATRSDRCGMTGSSGGPLLLPSCPLGVGSPRVARSPRPLQRRRDPRPATSTRSPVPSGATVPIRSRRPCVPDCRVARGWS